MTVTTITAIIEPSVLTAPSDPVMHAAATIARMRNGEMPLFLTGYEIMSAFQPLDADREELYAEPDECECGADYDDDMECECRFDYGYAYEDDDTLWDRKYDEIRWSDTAEDIAVNGVLNPISLRWDFTMAGDSGRPEVLGGHHRVALMGTDDPHTLMPVAFFDCSSDARRSLRDRY